MPVSFRSFRLRYHESPFFADHCISRSNIQSLENEGYTVYRLGNHIPADSPDREVISKTQSLDIVLISLNGDFFDIARCPVFDIVIGGALCNICMVHNFT